VPGDLSELLTPPVITGLVAVLLLVPPAGIALWRQHGHWRKAERAAGQARYTHTALQAALETAPEGHFVWFHQPAPDDDAGRVALPTYREGGHCSRRLAVLLDLFRGFEASFEEVKEGFDQASLDRLQNAVTGRIDLAVKKTSATEVTFAVRHATAEGFGPGLGVYLAQRMVELHGGRLDITTEGGDTIVACKLPTGGASGRQVGRSETVTARP